MSEFLESLVLNRERGVATRTNTHGKIAPHFSINRTTNEFLVAILTIVSLDTNTDSNAR